MIKKVLKKLSPIIAIGFVLVFVFIINRLNAVDAASESPYFLSVDGINEVTSIDLTNISKVQLVKKSDNNMGKIYTIKWGNVADNATDGATHNAYYTAENTIDGNVLAYKITPSKVGVETIYVNIWEGTGATGTTDPLYVLSCDVISNVTLNTNADVVNTYGADKIVIVDSNDVNAFKNIKKALIYNGKSTLDNYADDLLTNLQWETDNSSVINDNGNVLSVIGSGVANITARTYDNKIKVVFKVLVKPTIGKVGSATSTFLQTLVDIAWDTTTSSPASVYQFQTNARSNVLNYAFYDADTGKKTTNISKASDGNLATLNTPYAGKYYVIATALDASLLADSWDTTLNTFTQDPLNKVLNGAYAYATVTVPIKAENRNVAMNVGDSYNIFAHTNAPSDLAALITDFKGDYVGIDVSNQKVINGNAVGETEATVTTGDTYVYDSVSKTCILKPVQYKLNFIISDGIALNITETDMYVGATLNLTSSTLSGITWSSLDPTVATVVNGKVTALKKGFTIITATKTINGVQRKATCRITVHTAITKVTLDPSSASIDIGEALTMYAQIEPADTLDEDVSLRWFSSDTKIVDITASENSNKTVVLKGITTGKATITVVDTHNIVIASALVTVNGPVQKITLSNTAITTSITARTAQLVAYVAPDEATDKAVRWTSSDTKVATVDANGLVTFLTSGKVAIIATSKSNPEITAMCNIDITVPVTALSLDSSTKTIVLGKSERITYTVTPANASNNTVTWLSTNPAVATVSSTGYVTGVSVGQAVIIARTVDGNILQYCIVNVSTKPTGIALDKADLTMNKDEYTFLYATLTPANASENTIIWSSTDDKVVSVTQAGKVTAKGSGIALIFVKDAAGNTAYCKVTVIEHVKGIALNFSKKTMKKGNTFKLKATFTPTTASNKGVTYSSTDKSVASVASDGTVKGLKGGVTVITAKSKDGGYVDTCVVTVTESVTKIKLNQSYYKLGKGKTYSLKATVYNSSATNKTVVWKSSNPSVATVTSKGKITGRKLGYTTITAYATDGSGVSATCDVRVVTQVTSMRINKTSITLVEGRSTKLKATITPKNATYKYPKWSSSDKSVATVSSDGTVTGFKVGTAIITAAAKDNSGRKVTCFVNVIKAIPATSVTVLSSDTMLVVGESTILRRVVNPYNTTDSTRWYSDNPSIVSVNSITGKVTARRPGIAAVTCMVGGKSSTVKVTVVGLSRTSITLEQYSTYTLTVYGVTSGINWDTSDPEVCRISGNGMITSARVGSSIVTATVNGKKLYCRVTVVPIQ